MLTLHTVDGQRLAAVHLPALADPADRSFAIVVAHGFTGTFRGVHNQRIAAGLREHAGVLAFDFRGHGGSTGLSTVGDLEVLDVQAAVAHARGLGYRRVVTAGFSMGAAVAVRHAARYGDVDAVAAVSGPARWYYRGTPSMRWVHRAIEWPVGRLVSRTVLRTRITKVGWDPVPLPPYEAAALVSPRPLLIVHGDGDRFFPLRHAYELHHYAKDPRELWVERGMGHAEAAASPDLVERLGRWLRSSVTIR